VRYSFKQKNLEAYKLIKKITKLSSYIRKLRWGRLQSYICIRMVFLIYVRKYLVRYDEAISHI
jgi:hypothetical protein